MPYATIPNHVPYNNVNSSLVNIDASHYSGNAFTSTVNPSSVNPNALPEPANNIQAANSTISCMKGGRKRKISKRKINNISNMYKMKGSRRTIKRKIRKIKRTIRSKYVSKRRTRTRSRSHSMRGGYSQYQNNLPMTQTYSIGANLNASDSALANPAPYKVLSNCTNCIDNYNHFTNKGFPSRGSY